MSSSRPRPTAADSNSLKVIDEHSRLCLAIWVGRRCKAKDVVAVLEELTSLYPAPAYMRSDKWPDSTASQKSKGYAQALRVWCEASSTTSTPYIEPGSPWENGFVKSYELRSTASTTAGSGLCSSIPSCLPSLRRLKSWPIVGAGSTINSGCIWPPGAYAPGGSSTRESLDKWGLIRSRGAGTLL
jgi:hypothetical protein